MFDNRRIIAMGLQQVGQVAKWVCNKHKARLGVTSKFLTSATNMLQHPRRAHTFSYASRLKLAAENEDCSQKV